MSASSGNGHSFSPARVTLELEISVETEEREGYWAARSAEFKLMTYGTNRDEAEAKLVDAIDMMLDMIHARLGLGGVRDRLNALGVYHVAQIAGGVHVHRSKRTQNKQFAEAT